VAEGRCSRHRLEQALEGKDMCAEKRPVGSQVQDQGGEIQVTAQRLPVEQGGQLPEISSCGIMDIVACVPVQYESPS
jgi:hypothetical protein